MTIEIYEKLASEKVTDITWNIGTFKCILTKNTFLIVDLLECCNYFDVFKYGLLYSENDFNHYPHAFLKKRWGYCNRLRPSVRPSRYLLLNHWTKFNQIWCVGCSHEWGVQRHIFFWPRPLGPWGGAKRSNIIKCH